MANETQKEVAREIYAAIAMLNRALKKAPEQELHVELKKYSSDLIGSKISMTEYHAIVEIREIVHTL